MTKAIDETVFPIGTRVRYIRVEDSPYINAGDTGTVIDEDTDSHWLEFDLDIRRVKWDNPKLDACNGSWYATLVDIEVLETH